MSENSAISWTDHTWSPVWGCTQVSKAETGGGGCDNCYAKVLAHRFGYGWNGEAMREFGEHHWNEPVRWNKRAAKNGTRPKVFPSMCDPLDKDWPDGVRERFWRLVDATPYLTWLILTKRIGNYASLGPGAVLGRYPANVWLGATIVNQSEADRDIPKLLSVPARVRFLSVEPMLGPIDLERPRPGPDLDQGGGRMICQPWLIQSGINWVICGGESGPNARPMHPDWARSLRDQCAAAGVPFHFKQWGEWLPWSQFSDANVDDPPEQTSFRTLEYFDARWDDVGRPGYFEVMEGMVDDEQCVGRVGTKAAGRLLDGVLHNAFPGVA